MATLTQLSTSNLALKGAGDEYNYINRFFATKAEADAALADSSWAPVAGKLNACLTGDQGLLVYNESTSSLDLADAATRAYIDAQIGALVGDAPEVLDTLGEISDALNDNPNYFTDAAASTAANTALINAESGRAVAAENAIQADVDQNESDADAAIAAVQADVDQNESDADIAIAAVQADVDANEVARKAVVDIQSNITSVKNAVRGTSIEVGNNIAIHPAAGGRVEIEGDLLLDNQTDVIDGAGVILTSFTNINAYDGRLNTLEADPTTATAVAAVQADVDQNEADADTAIAAVQADVDANEAAALAARNAIQADVDQNESDADVAIAAETTARTAAVAAVQADVDQNESDADAAIAAVQSDVDANEAASIASLALKAPLASPALTGTPTSPTASQGAGTTQIATTAYVDTAVANLIDSSPGALDTLNELAAAIGDDANFSTTITNSIAAVQSDVNQNEIDADAAIAAVQADVDANEVTAAGLVTAENTAMLAAVAVVQADVDQNETDADAAIAAENTAMLAAVAVVQADVDQNETDADAADAALGVRIDSVETEIDTARTNIYTALGTSAESATAMGTFTGSTLSDNTTVRALLQELETDTESRLSKLGGVLTGDLTLRKSDGSAVSLILSRADHSDMNVVWKISPSYVSSSKEVLTVLANGQVVAHFDERQRFAINMTDPDYTLDVGGDGHFSTNLVVGGTLTLGSTAVTSTAAELNILDGVTSTAAELNILDGVTSTATELNLLDGVTATTAELNYTDVAAVGTAEASKAMVLDAGKSISGINQLTCVDLVVQGTTTTVDTVTMQASNAIVFEGATADSNETTLTIVDPDADRTIKLPNQSGCLPVLAADSNTAVTATPEELNYVDGVTSNIQTQLDAKLASETITLTAFQAVVAASSDFADFQSRVAAL
jgi:trimeric autotransporter adhesin